MPAYESGWYWCSTSARIARNPKLKISHSKYKRSQQQMIYSGREISAFCWWYLKTILPSSSASLSDECVPVELHGAVGKP